MSLPREAPMVGFGCPCLITDRCTKLTDFYGRNRTELVHSGKEAVSNSASSHDTTLTAHSHLSLHMPPVTVPGVVILKCRVGSSGHMRETQQLQQPNSQKRNNLKTGPTARAKITMAEHTSDCLPIQTTNTPQLPRKLSLNINACCAPFPHCAETRRRQRRCLATICSAAARKRNRKFVWRRGQEFERLSPSFWKLGFARLI